MSRTDQTCDHCHGPLNGKCFDGKLLKGPWADLCLQCSLVSFDSSFPITKLIKNESGIWAVYDSKILKEKAKTRPSIKTMEKWLFDGTARATDGCKVEPDETCEHGKRSWLLEEGLI